MPKQVEVNTEMQKQEKSVLTEPINEATDLPTPIEKPSKISMITQEEEPPPFTQASSYNSPRSAIFLSQDALHFVLG